MENHESEFMMRLRYQLVRARAVRDALLEEAQQMDVLVEAIELFLGGMEHHEES